MRSAASLAVLLAGVAACREVPSNLKSFYDSHKDVSCANPISIEYSSGQGDGDTVYCKDDASGAVFLKDSSNGYADALRASP
jgi:chitosanase